MTKTENQAAAKAFREQQDQKRREHWRALAVAADLDELRRIRHYLIFNSKVRVPRDEILAAIDDYVARLTGDRTTLHAPRHSIG